LGLEVVHNLLEEAVDFLNLLADGCLAGVYLLAPGSQNLEPFLDGDVALFQSLFHLVS
jgi:hypothetical protein